MANTYGAWDPRYNRPIVGGKVLNPTTGEVEAAGETFVAGPPSIDAIWVNIYSPEPPVWTIVRTSLNTSIDKALGQVALHIEQGIYSIVSLDASVYSLKIMCYSSKPWAEMRQALQTMHSNLDGEMADVPKCSRGNEVALPPAASNVEGSAPSGNPSVEENSSS